jgi:hypothetical protein
VFVHANVDVLGTTPPGHVVREDEPFEVWKQLVDVDAAHVPGACIAGFRAGGLAFRGRRNARVVAGQGREWDVKAQAGLRRKRADEHN